MLERSIWLKLFSIAFTFMRFILFYFTDKMKKLKKMKGYETHSTAKSAGIWLILRSLLDLA